MLHALADLWVDVAPWFAVNRLITLVLLLSITDVITGTLCAIRKRAVDSSISRDGLTRKAGLLIMLLLCKTLEEFALPGIPITATVAVGLIKMEGESLLENFDQLGLHIPYLAQYFAKIADTSETKKDG